MKSSLPKPESSYVTKVWQAVGILVLVISMILIARVAFNVILLILAGTLIATYFHGLADVIERRIKCRRVLAMLIGVLLTFIIAGTLTWFMGTKIQQQVKQLSETLPQTVEHLKSSLAKTDLGQKILEATGGDSDQSQKLLATAGSFFTTSFGVLGDLYIILFLGIFFTTNPDLYKNGLLYLVPPSRKPLGRRILDRISISLKGWLKGIMVSMVLVTIMISVGLSIIGIPAAIVLGLITGLLEIVPTLGSALAMIPGILLGLTVSPNTALIVAVVYLVSQTITANIVNPLIQKKMINLPPALTLISQLIMAAVSGVMGIILSVPILAIAVILIDELYVKKIHHEPEGKIKPVTAKGMVAGDD